MILHHIFHSQIFNMKQLEIERRWLLRRLPIDVRPDEIIKIEQWYREGDAGVIRYRRSSSSTAPGVKFEKIIKRLVAPGVNEEENFEIHGDKFAREIEPHMKYIRKVRRVYYHAGLKFEVDDFFNMKLVICEVELPTVADLSKPLDFHPDLAILIIKEITGQSEFSNFNLAKDTQ